MKNSNHLLLYSFLFLFVIGFANAVSVVNETIGAEPGVPYDLDVPTNCVNPTCTFEESPLFYFTNGSLIPYAENNTHYGTNSDCQVLPYSEYDNGTDIVDSPYTDQDNPVNWTVSYEYTCESTQEETCSPINFIMFNLLAVVFAAALLFFVLRTECSMKVLMTRVFFTAILILLVFTLINSLC